MFHHGFYVFNILCLQKMFDEIFLMLLEFMVGQYLLTPIN